MPTIRLAVNDRTHTLDLDAAARSRLTQTDWPL